MAVVAVAAAGCWILWLHRKVRQQAAALRDSEELHGKLVATIPDIVLRTDLAGNITFVNELGVRRVGFVSSGELVGKSVFSFIAPEEMARAVENTRLMLERPLGPREYRLVLGKGVRIGCEINGDVLRDVKGTAYGMVYVVRDITQRKRAEEALRTREVQLEETQRMAQLGRWELDIVQNKLEWSDEIFRIFEWDRQRFGATYEAFLQRVHPEDRERVDHAYRESLRQRTPYDLVHRLQMADGRIKFVLERCETFYSPEGTPLRSVGLVQDITERKQAEEALRESEEQYRSLFENAVEGVFQSTPEGRFLKVNPAMARVAGFASPEEMVAAVSDISHQLFVHPEQRREFTRLLEQHGLVQGFEYAFKCRDGSRRWVSVYCRAVRGPDGKPIRFEGIAEDITGRKRTEWLHAARGRAFDLLTTREPLSNILATLMTYVEGIWPGHPASILLLDESGQRLRHGAVTGLPEFYTQAIEGWEIGPNAGPGGVADCLKRRVVVDDVQTDPHWATVRELTARAGLVACWSEPIRSATGQVFGAFAVYAHRPMSPRGDDLHFLEEIARLTGLVIERNWAKEALRKSEEQYRELVENANSIIVKCDGEGRITFFNEYAQRFFGFTSEEVLGKHLVGTIVPSADSAGKDLAALMREIFANPARFRDCENENITKDGRRVDVRWSNKAVRNQEGGGISLLSVGTDVTERKRAEAELQRLYEQTRQDAQTKMELLNEINHRVKNNLTAILGLLLNELRHTPAEARAYVEPVLDGLSQRIQGLLHVHQMLSDRQWAPLPLSELAQNLIQTALAAVPADRQIVLRVPPSPVHVSPRQASNLALVLNELATNSAKHALADRKAVGISVRITQEPETLCLEYRDDGPGYPPAILRGERLGMGLDLIRKLVTGTLRGTLTLANDTGAVATLRIKTEEASRT